MLNFSASRLKLKLPLANLFYTNLPNLFTDPTPSGLSSDRGVTPHRQGALRGPPFPMLGFYSHFQMRFYPCTPPPPNLPWRGQVGKRVLSSKRAARPESLLWDLHCSYSYRSLFHQCTETLLKSQSIPGFLIHPQHTASCKFSLQIPGLQVPLCLPLERKLSLRCRLPRLPFWFLQNWE